MPSIPDLLAPRSPPVPDTEPRWLSLRRAGPVFDALAPASARSILATLADTPSPASVVAETVGTSTQNAVYHIDALQSAGLLTVVDTWYSDRGKEMDVFAASHDPLVVRIETPPAHAKRPEEAPSPAGVGRSERG